MGTIVVHITQYSRMGWILGYVLLYCSPVEQIMMCLHWCHRCLLHLSLPLLTPYRIRFLGGFPSRYWGLPNLLYFSKVTFISSSHMMVPWNKWLVYLCMYVVLSLDLLSHEINDMDGIYQALQLCIYSLCDWADASKKLQWCWKELAGTKD